MFAADFVGYFSKRSARVTSLGQSMRPQPLAEIRDRRFAQVQACSQFGGRLNILTARCAAQTGE